MRGSFRRRRVSQSRQDVQSQRSDVHAPFAGVVNAHGGEGEQCRRRQHRPRTSRASRRSQDEGEAAERSRDGKGPKGKISRSHHPRPEVEQDVVERWAGVRAKGGPCHLRGAGGRLLVLEKACKTSGRLGTGKLDIVASVGIGTVGWVLEAVARGDGEGEQLVGPEGLASPELDPEQPRQEGDSGQQKGRPEPLATELRYHSRDIPQHRKGELRRSLERRALTKMPVRATEVAKRLWPQALLVALVIALWLPRVGNPIDLRYDAGVYYILGTSLAEGSGYRLTNEPGDIEAVQYPPLLPAIVALHQRMLGSADPLRVGPILRLSFLGLSVLYGLVTYAMAQRFLSAPWALFVAAATSLQLFTVFLSNLCFGQAAFALTTVALVRDHRSSPSGPRPCSGRAGAGHVPPEIGRDRPLRGLGGGSVVEREASGVGPGRGGRARGPAGMELPRTEGPFPSPRLRPTPTSGPPTSTTTYPTAAT